MYVVEVSQQSAAVCISDGKRRDEPEEPPEQLLLF